MKVVSLKNDVKLFFVTASSFPAGIKSAWNKLYAILPSVEGRNFFGISQPDKNGIIIYKAAVEESYPGEAEKFGCKTFVCKKGKYLSEMIPNWQKDETLIGKTFHKILADSRIDRNGFCVEMYLGEKEMQCMVPMEDAIV